MRREVNDANDGAARVDDVQLSRGFYFFVLFDVLIVVQVRWEFRSGIQKTVAHSHARVRFRYLDGRALDNSFACMIVSSNKDGWVGERRLRVFLVIDVLHLVAFCSLISQGFGSQICSSKPAIRGCCK